MEVATYDDAVDRRVHAEGFTDDGVENGHILHVFVGHGAESTVWLAEEFDLLLIKLFPSLRILSVSLFV